MTMTTPRTVSFALSVLTTIASSLSIGCGSDDAGGGDEAGDSSGDASTTDVPTTDAPTTDAPTTDTPTTDAPTTDGSTTDASDTDASSGAEESTGEPVAPTVLDTVPADGDHGVLQDATVTIHFSTAMDKAATQAAYQSASLPAGDVTFAWNDTSDTLTITPNAPLVYAQGDDPLQLDAQAYAYTITTAAKSEAGTAMADDLSVSFTTLRHLQQVLSREVAASGNVDAAGAVGSSFFGDRSNDEPVRYAVSFDLTELAPDVANVVTADFRATWTMQSGNPWAGLGGGVVFQQVAYDSLDEAFDAPVTGLAGGLFGGVGDVDVARDASEQLGIALADPDTYHDELQLRLRWVLDTDNDGSYDSVSIVAGDLELAVDYLAP